jgi:hypothetical protein
MATPMLISATGRMMWPQRDSAVAMTGCEEKYRPAAHQAATPMRKTVAYTEMVAMEATAKIGA